MDFTHPNCQQRALDTSEDPHAAGSSESRHVPKKWRLRFATRLGGCFRCVLEISAGTPCSVSWSFFGVFRVCCSSGIFCQRNDRQRHRGSAFDCDNGNRFLFSLGYWASRPLGISLLTPLLTLGLLPKPMRRKIRENSCLRVCFFWLSMSPVFPVGRDGSLTSRWHPDWMSAPPDLSPHLQFPASGTCALDLRLSPNHRN